MNIIKLSTSETEGAFIHEKVMEHLRMLGLENKAIDVEEICKKIQNDRQFWSLFHSLFETYIVTHVLAKQEIYFPVKEVL